MSRRLSLPACFLTAWLTGWLAAYGMMLPALGALNMKEESAFALLLTGVLSLLSSLTGCLKKRRLPAVLAAAAALAAVWVFTGGARNFMVLVSSLGAGASPEAALAFHADTVLQAAALGFTLYAQLLIRSDPMICAPMLVFSALLFWFAGAREPLSLYLPGTAALALVLVFIPRLSATPAEEAAMPRRFRRAVPVVLLLTLLGLLAAPARQTVVPELARQADRLRQYINDRFFFTGSREMFSLAREGYQPMGDKGLGGRPLLSDVPVMEVLSDRRVYLRGAILNRYDGRRWADTLSSERYNYHSFRQAALRDSLMDAGLPLTDAAERREVFVHILRDGTSTLFTPQRIRKLSLGEGMVPWFNAASELFITRSLRPGDRYSVVYEPYVAGTAATDRLAASLSGADQTRAASLPEAYTQLPPHLTPDGIVAGLARRIVGGERDPYRQALALMKYLRNNYRYSLEVPDAPTDMDFAAHFLFEQKKGYCTYFATAMTVLCRSLGLPARYIEGFRAEGRSDAAAEILTSLNGHAWTEVYIAGLGWVTFDATASDDDREGPSPDADNPPTSPPSPSPSPSPEPPPEGPDSPPTPTPPPENLPEPSPDPTPEPRPEEPETVADRGGFPWWILLAGLLLFSLSLRRVRREEPVRRAARLSDETERFLLYWQSLLAVRALQGIPVAENETLMDYALRTEGASSALTALARNAGALLYGRHRADQESEGAVRLEYLRAYALLPALKKLRLRLRWAVQGLRRDLGLFWREIRGRIKNTRES